MALSEEDRKELESMGAANVRMHLQSFPSTGTGAAIPFKKGHLTKGDVIEWLSEQHRTEEAYQTSTLRWARIAGWASIIAVIVSIVGIYLQK